MRQPSLFIPHGGGPCFFMPDPAGNWAGLAAFLSALPDALPETPTTILVVSGHWETDGFAFTGSASPALIYDYNGFPPDTYSLRYDAPGDPARAERAASLLREAGLVAQVDPTRGFDHGVFVPMKVAFPEAKIPVIEMSLDRSLDPSLHIAAGRALAPLRDEGVLIVATGMSFHNMRGYGDPRFTAPSDEFNAWLTAAVQSAPAQRAASLAEWAAAPSGRISHPREEHLLPLMVASGASDEPGTRIYTQHVLKTALSGFAFA